MSNPNGNKQYLKPFQDRPRGEVQLIGSRGGKASTQTKKDGQKWRFLKERIAAGKVTSADSKWIVERVENDKAMAFHILEFLDSIKEKQLGPMQEIFLAKTYNDVHKNVHGEKIKSENVNINFNIDVAQAARDAFLKRKQMERDGSV